MHIPRTWLCVIAAATLSLNAATVSGVWTGSMEMKTPDGLTRTQPVYAAFKQAGDTITGKAGPTVSDSSEAQNIRLTGARLTFDILLPNGTTVAFDLQHDGSDELSGSMTLRGITATVRLKRGEPPAPAPPSSEIQPYDDVRVVARMKARKDISQADLAGKADLLPTLTFNQKTAWPAARMPQAPKPEDLLKAAMDPGLGVREIHARGITGKGVVVGIIDQPVYPDHPEFEGKIAAYEDVGCNSASSMHGPSVLSLLAGNNTGVAPGVKVYYAAAPSWTKDAAFQAKALDWIVARNRELPQNGKIRVVSVSSAPSGSGSPFDKNNALWDEAVRKAEDEGILVLDCTSHRGIIGACWLKGDQCIPGFAGTGAAPPSPKRVVAPTSPRTTAEEYDKGDFGYVYWGRGGLSWAVPYSAGVLALGWQVRPEMTHKEAVELLFRTAGRPDGQTPVINPRGFLKAVEESKK